MFSITSVGRHFRGWIAAAVTLSALAGFCSTAQAQSSGNPFTGGWQLETSSSSLTFQSIKEKDGPKQETSSFASFTGEVDETGLATVKVQLDSVDTKVDLRNVRMRFLFFETFKFPEATVRTQVDEALMARLAQQRRLTTPIQFELDLHGVKKQLEVNTVMTLFAEDQLSIASVEPVSIATGLFNLDEGIAKLQDAAKVSIVPSGAVSFDLVFTRKNAAGVEPLAQAESVSTSMKRAPVVAASTAAVSTAAAPAAASTALESAGNLTRDECLGRFEILSETGAIYFRSGSARLDPESYALLGTVLDVISRCPSLEVVVAGHTDSAGSDDNNLRLSILRANSVLNHLVSNGVDESRVTAIGFGEARPVAPNDSARNRSRNRRIEFTVTSG